MVQEVREIRKKAEEGRLSLDELSGATLAISNLGMFGIRAFDAVITYGERVLDKNYIKMLKKDAQYV